MEDFLSALGAEPVKYPYRNECCGGYIAMEDQAAARKSSRKVTRSASLNGAEALITACPLCLYNLKENGGGEVPVYYFTELLAAALGLKALEGGLARAS
jgi:heterodisulfide reductase subunit B